MGAREGDVVLSGDIELVVWVAHEDELEEALERFDPELLVLASRDADEPLQHVLDLLSDVPAGKLVIADTGGATTQDELDELERAGDRRRARAQRGVTRERRNAAATGIAVFLAGAVLLGLEIAPAASSRRTFGSSLYVWGALIGVVLAGLSIGYWLGGALADRLPTPRLLVGDVALGALLVLAIPFVDGWVLDQVVAWDPGAATRPSRRDDRSLRRAGRRPRRRLARGRAAARARARPPGPDGRAAVRGLDRRVDRRHLPDRVLADPRARHRPAARRLVHRVLMLAARSSPSAERLDVAFVAAARDRAA